MKTMYITDKDGNRIEISVMGMFRVPDLDKEYIMYGLTDDDETNENGHVLLGEVLREDDEMKIVGILPEEKDVVVAYYNEISTQLGGE